MGKHSAHPLISGKPEPAPNPTPKQPFWGFGIHDVAYAIGRVPSLILYYQEGEWGLFAANFAGGLGKLIWWQRDKIQFLRDGLKQPGTALLKTPTYIVDLAMLGFAAWDCFNGIGVPDRGESFYLGKVEFENVHSYLRLADPIDECWQGDAAEAYKAQNQILKDCAARMQVIDSEMQQLAKEHGDLAKQTHDHFLAILTSLVAAQAVALALYSIPGAGPTISLAWQIAFVAGMLSWGLTEVTKLVKSSQEKALKIEAKGTDYDNEARLVEELVTSGSWGTVVLEKPDATENKPSGGPMVSSMPTITEVLEMAGAAGAEHLEILRMLARDGATSGIATAGETMAQTPPAPVFTLPTPPSPIGQASAQTAKISGHASRHMNLVNQTMGSPQQLASRATQGHGTAAPAEEAAERAPIDAAAGGAEEPQQRSLAKRIA